MSRVCVTCTGLDRWTRSNLLPGGDCNKGLWVPQGPIAMDEVIRAVSWIEEPVSATLPRFHSAPGNRGFLHQANLSAQEALPPAGAWLSPPHVHKGRRQTDPKPPSQGAPPPDSVAGFRSRVKRRFRLRRQSDFQAAIAGKRVYTGRALVAFAVPCEADESRVGVTVSRNVKGSVDRNRARRRLREVARERLLGPDSPLHGLGIRYDVVLIARPAALVAPFADLEAETEQAALRLSKLKP
jgi:ribonuclease P protein component